MKKLSVLFCFFCLLACDKSSELEKEIKSIPVTVNVSRFDLDYMNIKPEGLPGLKNKYPFMFSEQYPDSLWIAKISDTLQRSLFSEVYNRYPDFDKQQEELHSFFQHVKYYYPNDPIPEVITVTSEVDYQNQIIYTDKYLIVSLDTYLGPDHKFYKGMQQYLVNTFDAQYILPDIAAAYAGKKVPTPTVRDFLNVVVWYGKRLYLESVLLPEYTDAQLLKYSKDQIAWASINEDKIWEYFMENEIVFSTSPKNIDRFVNPAPFSKFYMSFDNESPGRLGIYIGYNIVKAYMQNNDASVKQMLNTPAEEIFKNAHYKPKK